MEHARKVMETLEEFIEGNHRNKWLRFPGLSAYLRRSKGRLLGTEMAYKVLDLANMEADEPGKGAWTQFIESLRIYPKLQKHFDYLFVENVLTEQFSSWFRSRGWKEMGDSIAPCFYISTKDFVEGG